MPQETILRDAVPEDALSLSRIHIIARRTAMPWLATVHSDVETDAWMAEKVLPHHRVRVATVGAVAVGFAVFASDSLEQLYVDPEHQNRGIGSLLFKDACAAARGPFRFWVFQRNAAAR